MYKQKKNLKKIRLHLKKAWVLQITLILTSLFFFTSLHGQGENQNKNQKKEQSALFERAHSFKQENSEKNKDSLISTYFLSDNLPQQSLVPGGIALIPFEYAHKESPASQTNHYSTPEVHFQNNRILSLQTGRDQWLAIVGLPLSLKPGTQELQIKGAEKITFTVKDKEYESQYITLKNTSQVNPNTDSLTRIHKESKIMKTVFKSWSITAPKNLSIAEFPTEGPLSSQFGLKRFFNNQARRPHSGLDIAASTGTEIKSPLAGKVAAVGNYYFNGNTVLIDHGQGLISMYCHMDSIKVKQGDNLNANTPIGTVGTTGRSTGPHLHWSMSLNNTRIDPLLFMKSTTEKKTNSEP